MPVEDSPTRNNSDAQIKWGLEAGDGERGLRGQPCPDEPDSSFEEAATPPVIHPRL